MLRTYAYEGIDVPEIHPVVLKPKHSGVWNSNRYQRRLLSPSTTQHFTTVSSSLLDDMVSCSVSCILTSDMKPSRQYEQTEDNKAYGRRGNNNDDTYGSGNTNFADTYGSSNNSSTDAYGSSNNSSTDTYGSSNNSSADTYGSARFAGDTYGSTRSTDTTGYGSNSAYDSGTGGRQSNQESSRDQYSAGSATSGNYRREGVESDTSPSYGASRGHGTDQYSSGTGLKGSKSEYGTRAGSGTETYGSGGDGNSG